MDVSGYRPWGATLDDALSDASLTVGDAGNIPFTVPTMGYQIWVTANGTDFTAP